MIEDSIESMLFSLNFDQKNEFHSRYVRQKKNETTARILSLPLLGTFGLQQFYLGNFEYGILSVLFSWTFIPTFYALYELISGDLHNLVLEKNEAIAQRIINTLQHEPPPAEQGVITAADIAAAAAMANEAFDSSAVNPNLIELPVHTTDMPANESTAELTPQSTPAPTESTDEVALETAAAESNTADFIETPEQGDEGVLVFYEDDEPLTMENIASVSAVQTQDSDVLHTPAAMPESENSADKPEVTAESGLFTSATVDQIYGGAEETAAKNPSSDLQRAAESAAMIGAGAAMTAEVDAHQEAAAHVPAEEPQAPQPADKPETAAESGLFTSATVDQVYGGAEKTAAENPSSDLQRAAEATAIIGAGSAVTAEVAAHQEAAAHVPAEEPQAPQPADKPEAVPASSAPHVEAAAANIVSSASHTAEENIFTANPHNIIEDTRPLLTTAEATAQTPSLNHEVWKDISSLHTDRAIALPPSDLPPAVSVGNGAGSENGPGGGVGSSGDNTPGGGVGSSGNNTPSGGVGSSTGSTSGEDPNPTPVDSSGHGHLGGPIAE